MTTIQQFLRTIHKDHTIVTLPLGGASMINGKREPELVEVCRISENVSALIDSERSGEEAALAPDREAFRESCRTLGIDCHVLERRAIENYFPARAIQLVRGVKYRALGPFEKAGEMSPSWNKAENWRIARVMTREELNATEDLGIFISSV